MDDTAESIGRDCVSILSKEDILEDTDDKVNVWEVVLKNVVILDTVDVISND